MEIEAVPPKILLNYINLVIEGCSEMFITYIFCHKFIHFAVLMAVEITSQYLLFIVVSS